jgi:hypothetical protein
MRGGSFSGESEAFRFDGPSLGTTVSNTGAENFQQYRASVHVSCILRAK